MEKEVDIFSRLINGEDSSHSLLGVQMTEFNRRCIPEDEQYVNMLELAFRASEPGGLVRARLYNFGIIDKNFTFVPEVEFFFRRGECRAVSRYKYYLKMEFTTPYGDGRFFELQFEDLSLEFL